LRRSPKFEQNRDGQQAVLSINNLEVYVDPMEPEDLYLDIT